MTVAVMVRRSDLRDVGQVDAFTKLTVNQRGNDVSTWSMTVDAGATVSGEPISTVLDDTTSTGIRVLLGGRQVLSGFCTQITDAEVTGESGRRGTLTFSGVDDTGWLADQVVDPRPNAEVFRTGSFGYVADQLVSWCNPGTPPVYVWGSTGIGPTTTARSRFKNLLEELKELSRAVGGVRWGVEQGPHPSTGVPTLIFRVHPIADRSASVKLTYEAGTLAGHNYKGTRPKANRVFVLGQGEGASRTVVVVEDAASIAIHGPIEVIKDQRNTNDNAELIQSGQEILADSRGVREATLSPVQTAVTRYLDDYSLMDIVSVGVPGRPLTLPVTEVDIEADSNGVTVKPSVSTPGGGAVRADLFSRRRFAAIQSRLHRQEAR